MEKKQKNSNNKNNYLATNLSEFKKIFLRKLKILIKFKKMKKYQILFNFSKKF